MITISKPRIEERDGQAFLCSTVTDGQLDKSYELWYATDARYRDCLCSETADSFLVCMLQIAMHTHQDIRVEAPISSKLYNNIRNTGMPLLSKAVTDAAYVKIIPESISFEDFGGKGVGCSCSLGVDSFVSLLKQMEPDVPENYRPTHLFLARAVHFGQYKLEEAGKAFRENAKRLEKFAEEVKLELVTVDSNLDVPYLDHKEIGQTQRGLQCTLSAVLALQKLFGKYVFASSYTADSFKVTDADVAYCESAFVPSLSTDSTEIILATPMMSRVERTAYICKNPHVVKWLDVCWATVIENGYRESKDFEGRTHRNCGKCLKCLRTELTLELLGVLGKYKDAFDLEEYRKYRNKYLTFILCCHKKFYYEEEIFQLMKEKHFKFPFIVYLYSLGVKSGMLWIYKKLSGKFILPQP